MKKALSLIEVLVSIILISVVITALLSIKDNNLSFIEKMYSKDKYNAYISLLALDYETIENRSKNVFISDVIDFNDDELKLELSSVKVTVKDKIIDTKDFEEAAFSYKIYKSSFVIENKTSKNFFTIRIVK